MTYWDFLTRLAEFPANQWSSFAQWEGRRFVGQTFSAIPPVIPPDASDRRYLAFAVPTSDLLDIH